MLNFIVKRLIQLVCAEANRVNNVAFICYMIFTDMFIVLHSNEILEIFITFRVII